METVIRWTLILACMAVVLWVRLLPLQLSAADDRADLAVRQQIRARLAQAAAQQSQPTLRREQLDQQVEEWIEKNQAQFAQQKAETAQRLKERLQYTGPDGETYVYLGGVDSYLWMRHARNSLQKGTPCDAIIDGECRDTYGMAPVGAEMIYARSLHTDAIAGLHKLITRFKPDYPLPATAFLVPVIVGTLGVLPAFYIGWGLGGNVGGVCAALLTALHPVFLTRSIGGDNDVWNVVLPLFMMWAALTAMAALGWRRQVVAIVLAAACVGLHAAVWRGWVFSYGVLLLALIGLVCLHGAAYAVRGRTLRVWPSQEVRRAVLMGVIFFVAAGVFTALAGAEHPYLKISYRVLEPLWDFFFARGGPVAAGLVNTWPNTLRTVGELLKPTLWMTVGSLGGMLVFGVGLLGLLLVVLPRDRWQWYHWLVLMGGIVFYGYLFTRNRPDRLFTLGVLALPLAATLLLRAVDEHEELQTAEMGPALIVITWFLAALFTAYEGIRFLLQASTIFGVTVAVAVGRLSTRLSEFVRQRVPTWYQWPTYVLLYALFVVALFQPLRQGYSTARRYVPRMSDGWWDTLTKIRDQAAPDAIVSTWWDYGHWAKYTAERRVSADGSALLTHVPHWLGRVLAASSERESVGVLRMLNCGSDAAAAPERQQGAYGKVLAKVTDEIAAHEIVMELVTRDAAQAQEYLALRGFTPAEQDDVLRSTHCVPPESYLIISGEQILKTGAWMHLGLWDFRRAYLARRSRYLSQAEAVPDLTRRFGYSEEEATRWYTQAKALKSHDQAQQFIAPRSGYLLPQWIPCRPEKDETTLVCPLGVTANRAGIVLESFVYRPTAPLESKLYFSPPRSRVRKNFPTEGAPAVLVLADVQKKEEITFPSPPYSNLGVLLDVPQRRILVGPPPLLRSTFTHLMYLNGRYAQYYEKFDERLTYWGERIVTWKVKWDGQEGARQKSAPPVSESQPQEEISDPAPPSPANKE